ncbi:hypothetical protein BDR26DRAFT_291798 [Obelidium mucronatum]|nr:hypothetical protein BDR26DRAFT_291798 [Obelidium mucronatum]
MRVSGRTAQVVERRLEVARLVVQEAHDRLVAAHAAQHVQHVEQRVVRAVVVVVVASRDGGAQRRCGGGDERVEVRVEQARLLLVAREDARQLAERRAVERRLLVDRQAALPRERRDARNVRKHKRALFEERRVAAGGGGGVGACVGKHALILSVFFYYLIK